MTEVSNGKEMKCRSGDAFGRKCLRTADEKLKKKKTVM